MDLIQLLVLILIFALVFWLATWIIRQTFPADAQRVPIMIIGVIALLVLLSIMLGYVHVPLFHYRY